MFDKLYSFKTLFTSLPNKNILFSKYYTKNVDGLIEFFYMAIPFFKNTILSTFFYCKLILLTENIYHTQKKYKLLLFFKIMNNIQVELKLNF